MGRYLRIQSLTLLFLLNQEDRTSCRNIKNGILFFSARESRVQAVEVPAGSVEDRAGGSKDTNSCYSKTHYALDTLSHSHFTDEKWFKENQSTQEHI